MIILFYYFGTHNIMPLIIRSINIVLRTISLEQLPSLLRHYELFISLGGLEIALGKTTTNHRVSNPVNVVTTQYRHAKIGSTSTYLNHGGSRLSDVVLKKYITSYYFIVLPVSLVNKNKMSYLLGFVFISCPNGGVIPPAPCIKEWLALNFALCFFYSEDLYVLN